MRRKPKHRKLYRRPKPPSVSQVFATIELADSAIKKLFLDEPLSNEELKALFDSDYLGIAKSNDVIGSTESLYTPSPLAIVSASSFLFTDIEQEVLAYFGRHPEMLFSVPPRRFEELAACRT